jgi:hypothetical protein
MAYPKAIKPFALALSAYIPPPPSPRDNLQQTDGL